MRVRFAWAVAALCAACGPRSSYVRVNDVPLGRVVVYRNGIAYFERSAHVDRGMLKVSVPRALSPAVANCSTAPIGLLLARVVTTS